LIKEHEKSCEIIHNEMNLLKEKVKCEICGLDIPLISYEVHEQNCIKMRQQYNDLDAWAKGKMDYPDDWIFDSDLFKSDFCMMPVDKYQHHVKYEWLEQKLMDAIPKIRINHIWRLQNKELWQKYYYEKIKLQKEKGSCKESWLFFGSHQMHPEKFFQLGFDHAYSAEHGEVGKGIYFYQNPDYVLRQKGCFSKDGKHFMLLCKVLTGTHFVEKNAVKHRKTPFIDEKKLIYYDSITNHEVANPDEIINYHENKHLYEFYNHYFAVYDNHKAYPLYLIEFVEKKDDEL